MKTIRNYELKVKRVKLVEPHAAYGRAVHEPNDVTSIAQALIGDQAQEVFIVLLLDIKNRVVGFTEAGRGGIDTCPVDPRVIFRAAIACGASAIIVSHNHPSGGTSPSSEDLKLTEQLHRAGKLLGISLLDHVIVTDNETMSMAAQGMMPT